MSRNACAVSASGFSTNCTSSKATVPLFDAPVLMYPNPVSGELGVIPKVTRQPRCATSAPATTAVRKPSTSAIAWSAGIASSSGGSSGEVCRASCAASANAGAVLRPSVSSTTASRLYPRFSKLVQHEKSVRLVAHDDGCSAPVEADKPHGGFLQQGALADEREELLRHVLAGQRPEPAARTAGKDHGLKGASAPPDELGNRVS